MHPQAKSILEFRKTHENRIPQSNHTDLNWPCMHKPTQFLLYCDWFIKNNMNRKNLQNYHIIDNSTNSVWKLIINSIVIHIYIILTDLINFQFSSLKVKVSPTIFALRADIWAKKKEEKKLFFLIGTNVSVVYISKY